MFPEDDRVTETCRSILNVLMFYCKFQTSEIIYIYIYVCVCVCVCVCACDGVCN